MTPKFIDKVLEPNNSNDNLIIEWYLYSANKIEDTNTKSVNETYKINYT